VKWAISIFQYGGHRVGNLLPGTVFCAGIRLGRWKSITMPNFDVICQSTAKIKLLPVSENGRPPYWNPTSGVDFGLCVVTGMSFCICLLNYVVIRWSETELWCHIDFSRWRTWSRKSTSEFCSSDSTHLRRREIYLHTKFHRDISIHSWDKTTSGFGKRTAAILEFYFLFRFWPNLRPRCVILHQPILKYVKIELN